MALVTCVLAREKRKERGPALIGVLPSLAGDRGKEEDLYCDEACPMPPAQTGAAQLLAAVKSSCGGKKLLNSTTVDPGRRSSQPMLCLWSYLSRDPILSSLSPQTIILSRGSPSSVKCPPAGPVHRNVGSYTWPADNQAATRHALQAGTP